MRSSVTGRSRAKLAKRAICWMICVMLCVVMAVAIGAPRVARASAPGGTPGEREAAAEAGPGQPRVHIEVRGRVPLTLYEIEPSGEAGARSQANATGRALCRAPCDLVVDGRQGQSFSLGGPGLTPSIPFSLLRSDAEITIHARPGRRAVRISGWVLASVGAAVAIAGAATLTAADDDRDLRRAGGFTFLAGLPVLAAGIVMVALGRTRFRLGARRR